MVTIVTLMMITDINKSDSDNYHGNEKMIIMMVLQSMLDVN